MLSFGLWILRGTAFAIAFVFVYLIWIGFYEIKVFKNQLKSIETKYFFDYAGIINVQSQRSTGTGSFEDIVDAAQVVGLDFIFLTDLNVFGDSSDLSGYYDHTLVSVGYEYSYLDARVIQLNTKDWGPPDSIGQAQVKITDYLSQDRATRKDRFLIWAHPLKPQYSWSGDPPAGFDAVEVMNLKSIWQKAYLTAPLSFTWTVLMMPFNSRLGLLRTFDNVREEIGLWEQLNRRHPVVATAGADAEQKYRLPGGGYLKYPTYQTMFSLIRNHILLDSELTGVFSSDRDKIWRALSKGQSYLCVDAIAHPQGFSTFIQDQRGKVYPLGAQIKYTSDLILHVELPIKPMVPFRVKVVRNGSAVFESTSEYTQFRLPGTGQYRVEVIVNPKLPLPDQERKLLWILTNHFYVD